MFRCGVCYLAVGVALLAVVPPATAENYALLAGVKSYPARSGLSSLTYTEEDVHDLAAALGQTGYAAENIVLLTQQAAVEEPRYNPIAVNIRRELELLLAGLTDQDSVIVALSGHGVQYNDERDVFFCPSDVVLRTRENLVSLAEVYTALEACAAATRVLLVDACRDDPELNLGKGAGNQLQSKGARSLGGTPPRGIAAFFSCRAGQTSYESNELQNGVFFHYVAAALSGEGDLDRDGEVTLAELEQFSIKKVQTYARLKIGELQTPERRGESEGLMTLARLPSEPDGVPDPAPDPVPESVPDPAPDPITDSELLIAPFTAAQVLAARSAWGARLQIPAEHTNGAGVELVLIPPGEFTMGSPEGESNALFSGERPQHRVRISRAFYMARTEVTVGQFRQFVNAENYRTEAERNGQGGRGWNEAQGEFDKDPKYSWQQTGWKITEDHPVVNVTWNDAAAYCKWLSQSEGQTYRLPTEAEWEYACRAGTVTRYSFRSSGALAENANVADAAFDRELNRVLGHAGNDRFAFTAPVGRFPSNSFGLSDMHGNVREWCGDWYYAEYYESLGDGTSIDPAGPRSATSRVSRGGSWIDVPQSCRSACRCQSSAYSMEYDLGFRVVAVPAGE